MRRNLDVPWFGLIAEVGGDNSKVTLPLREKLTTFTATASGKLYLYVNDAVNAIPIEVPATAVENADGSQPTFCAYQPREADQALVSSQWCGFYTNNHGSAQITVSKIKPEQTKKVFRDNTHL